MAFPHECNTYITVHEYPWECLRLYKQDQRGGNLSSHIACAGAGKSLIYQCAAVIRGGLTVVVSPLLSLIQDQVDLTSMHTMAHGLHALLSSTPTAMRLLSVAGS